MASFLKANSTKILVFSKSVDVAAALKVWEKFAPRIQRKGKHNGNADTSCEIKNHNVYYIPKSHTNPPESQADGNN